MSRDEQELEWKLRAEAKEAIVPQYWEVSPNRVLIDCGNCRTRFFRTLVPNVNDPLYVCPKEGCGFKNMVPLTFERRR